MPLDAEPEAQGPGSLSKNGLFHCKVGQETVHDIVAKTTELFNHLKTINVSVQPTLESESKKTRIKDTLNLIQHKFETLRRHFNNVNEICSSLSYIQIKSLIPYKDDPDNVEQIQKHRHNLYAEATHDVQKEKDELLKMIAERDERLVKITHELREFIYEINTMLNVSKTQT